MTIATLLFVGLLLLNVWQAYRLQNLEGSIRLLEREQQTILEENKRLIATIGILRSPLRTGPLAEETLELRRISPDQIITIERSDLQ